MKKVVLVTGASSGIGKETAKLFAQNAYQVIATARTVEKMKDLEELGCLVFPMDVTKEESIQLAFQNIFKTVKKIDILINNAGYSQNGFVEELGPEQLRYQFEVNIFGLIRVSQMVLPKMREAQSGTIVNIGSVGGEFTTPGASAYHASKYALESFSDGMRQELAQFGIKVVLVKPGGVATEFINHSNALFPQPIAGNPYGSMRERFLKMLETVLDAGNSSFPILKPIEVAKAIFNGATNGQAQTRIRVGRTAKMMPIIKSLMSDKAFDRMIMKQLGLAK